MIYLLVMIITGGGNPLPIAIRMHDTEAACIAERDRMADAEKARKRQASDVDFVCQEKIK